MVPCVGSHQYTGVYVVWEAGGCPGFLYLRGSSPMCGINPPPTPTPHGIQLQTATALLELTRANLTVGQSPDCLSGRRALPSQHVPGGGERLPGLCL